jgi:hypothetical protein
MLKRSVVAVLLLLALLAVSCRKPKSAEAWIPRHAPWSDGEVSSYDVLKDDSIVGQSVYSIRATEIRDRRAWEILGVNSSADGGLHDSVAATLSYDELKSLGSIQVRNMIARLDTVVSRYDREKVVITARAGQAQSLPVSANTFDNSILVIVIRALDLKPDARFLLTSVASFGPWTKPADVQVLGEDTVTVPAGRFACRKVALQLAGWTMNLWYERDAPYRYIKFENRNNNSTAVLTGYRTDQPQ